MPSLTTFLVAGERASIEDPGSFVSGAISSWLSDGSPETFAYLLGGYRCLETIDAESHSELFGAVKNRRTSIDVAIDAATIVFEVNLRLSFDVQNRIRQFAEIIETDPRIDFRVKRLASSFSRWHRRVARNKQSEEVGNLIFDCGQIVSLVSMRETPEFCTGESEHLHRMAILDSFVTDGMEPLLSVLNTGFEEYKTFSQIPAELVSRSVVSPAGSTFFAVSLARSCQLISVWEASQCGKHSFCLVDAAVL